MSKCEKAGIPVPKVHVVDTKKNRIIMEKIEGVTVKEYFLSLYLETEHRKYFSVRMLVMTSTPDDRLP